MQRPLTREEIDAMKQEWAEQKIQYFDAPAMKFLFRQILRLAEALVAGEIVEARYEDQHQLWKSVHQGQMKAWDAERKAVALQRILESSVLYVSDAPRG